jgi:hypothetical protein
LFFINLKKKLIFRSIFWDFTDSPQPGSWEAVCKARRLMFLTANIKRFRLPFFAWRSATNIWPQITRQSSRSISSSSDRLASNLKRTGRVDFLMSVLAYYGLIIYRKVAREPKLDLRLTLSVDQFLHSSEDEVYPMNFKLTLNFDGLFEVKYWSPTLKQKNG